MSHDPNRVALLFAAAIAQPSPSDRAAYLDEACAGDSELRRLVEEMLTVHDAQGGPPEAAHAAPAVTVDSTTAIEGPGMRIGPYKLLQRLGEGGMGTVYMAEQEQPVRRRVALKIIKAGMDSTQVAARFEQERQALAVMDHPNIAKVLDAGATAMGRPFFVMELVKGISITRFCDQERLTPKERIELFTSVCQAVQHAHGKGIIHRDLKPSNVLVALYDGKPVAKVIDFGVAKATQQKLTERTLFTEVGRIVGTLEYMAPEQAELNNLDVDTRADVYSLGALLYELLTGGPPFSAKQLRGAAHDEMLRMIREVEPPKPSTRLSSSDELPSIAANRKLEPRGLTSLVAGELDWIVMKALEKERHRRYETAHALAMDLQHYLSNEPVLAGPPSAGYRVRKFLRRNQGPVAAAGLVLVMLVGGILGTSWGLVRSIEAGKAEAQQRRIAQDKERDALAAEKRAIGERDRANQARESELGQLYAADMLLASRAVIDGPLARALDILDGWLPERRAGKDHRDGIWHLLRRRCDTSEKVLIGHEGPLRALAWSTGGKRIASGGADQIIRVWDADTGKCLQTLVGHSAGVFDVAFSPDGTLLASASADCTVRLWDVESGQQRHILRGHILPAYSVVLDPSGKNLASAGGDTVIKLWDAASGNEVFSLQGHEAAVGKLQFDAEGTRLASCGIIGGTLLWDLHTRQVVDRLQPNGDFVFTPDFATGAFAFADGTIGFRDVKAKAIDQGGLGLNGIHAIALSDAARIAAISGTDDAIHVIDRAAASTLVTHRGHLGPARRLLLRADARKLASAGDDGSVRIWDLPDPNVPRPFAGHHEHIITAVGFSIDGALLASGDYLGSIAVWNSETGRRHQILGSHYIRRKSDEKPLEIGTGKPLLDGTLIKNKVGLSGSATMKDPIVEMIVCQGHAAEVKGLAFTPDKRVLVSAGATGMIIWDLESGKPIKEIEHPTLVSSLAVSPDGELAATGCWDDIVRVFRVPSGVLVKELEGHTDDVMCVAFDPSGKVLASGGRDHTAIVWDVETGEIKHRLAKHVNTVSVVRYTPDGKRLLTCGLDKAIHVWDAETGTYQSSLHSHNEGVTSLAFSADGSWLVSASDGMHDKLARVWVASASQFREAALIKIVSNKGPSALAVHPVTGALFIGRQELSTFETTPWVELPPSTAEPIDPQVARAKAPTDGRLMALGYAIVDEIAAWPNSEKARLKPSQPGGKFLVVATSLPFSRLKLSDADYRELLDRKRNDQDAVEPLKFSSMLIYPERFVLAGEDEKPISAQFVGRMALSKEQGFEFMANGVSMLENMTATPQLDDRQLVYLGWEVGEDFSPNGLQLRFENDEPVEVPSLKLETFRPGRPFYPASRGFEAGEEGNRLRSQISRSPGP